jgi:hypothetical protein
MALIAMTTADTIDYVSIRDPSKKPVKKEVKAATPDEAAQFIDDFEIGPGATVFSLKPLDVFLMGFIYDNASTLSGKQGTDEVGIHTRVNQTNIECVRHGLAGFKNFTDAKGGQVTFKTQKAVVNGRTYDVAGDAVINMMGVRLIQELAAQIKSISEVSASEEKN